MDHNLDDSLNLENSMGVDFDHSEDTVVNQDDITLDGGNHEENISMEFENIVEQPILMDTGNEEVIVPDFMEDQFTMQEYTIPDDQFSQAIVITEDIATTQADITSSIGEPLSVPAKGFSEERIYPKVNIKPAPTLRPIAPKKEVVTIKKSTAPKQVAIAPKPTTFVQRMVQNANQTNTAPKQYVLAPKLVKTVTMMGPGTGTGKQPITVVKKLPIGVETNVSKANNTVLAQMNKQVLMVPSGSGQKLKLVSSGSGPLRLINTSDGERTQLVTSSGQVVTAGAQSNKVMTKVFVQGSSNVDMSNQPAVITKLMSTSTPSAPDTQMRYVTVNQKSVPISLGNKVIVSSPSKFGKRQIINLKSPTTKILPAPGTIQGVPGKKIVYPSTNSVVVVPPKAGQVPKTTGPTTQLHQINVPGKGIQYIRLVTNPSASAATTKHKVIKAQPTIQPAKTFILTDSKGTFYQMPAEKLTNAPPPLIVTSSGTTGKAVLKTQQKLVKIAPITSKISQTILQEQKRGKSLLAPMAAAAPAESAVGAAVPGHKEILEIELPMLDSDVGHDDTDADADADADVQHTIEIEEHKHRPEEELDSKSALRALIADTVGSDADNEVSSPNRTANATDHAYNENSTYNDDMDNTDNSENIENHEEHLQMHFDSQQIEHDENSIENSDSQPNHPIIVVPSYMKHNTTEDHEGYDDPREESVDMSACKDYSTQLLHDNELSAEMMRARKACNCTKSQCLKLYCDCFASGEFCNQCNCNNCHNNLENEELRQKAIRGCLDRNPNAFRPKIGKTKAGGPEIIRRHNKGCNCKRSGCLKNYCECFEAKIACTNMCKCVGCRNVEETLDRGRRRHAPRHAVAKPVDSNNKQPCSFMTREVIEAVCQCLVAAAGEGGGGGGGGAGGGGGGMVTSPDPVRDVLDEFARCLHDIIGASAHAHQPIIE